MLCFVLLSKFRMGAMDSKAGSWQHAGCMLQPAWLFRRKANPPPPTKEESTNLCSLLFCAENKKSPYQGKKLAGLHQSKSHAYLANL